MSIKQRLIILFVLFSVFPVGFVSILATVNAGHDLVNEELTALANMANIRKLAIEDMIMRVSAGRPARDVPIEEYAKELEKMSNFYSAFGKTGELIVVGHDNNGDALLLTPTRFEEGAALHKTISQSRLDVATVQALSGKEGVAEDTVDYRNHPVFAAMRYIPEMDWGLVIKIDQEEALAPAYTMRNLMIIITLITVVVSGLAGYAVARSISDPLEDLSHIVTDISKGKLDVKLDKIDTKDEIGDLARAFDRTIISLKLAMREMGEKSKAGENVKPT